MKAYMGKKAYITLNLAAVSISKSGSCHKNKNVVNIQNSRICLDWAGEYTGIAKYNGVSGIEVLLRLNYDDSFELKLEDLDNSCGSINWRGSFKWDDAGNNIIIDIINTPLIYHVASNKLIRLDKGKNNIISDQADEQVLIKKIEKTASASAA